MIAKIKRNTTPLPVRVAEELTQMVLTGAYKPGDRLPSENELCELLNVSRTTVREATKLLVSQNILEIHRGNGTYVCEQVGVSDDPLGLKFISDKQKLGRDLYAIRMMIEPEAAALAAKNAKPEEIEEMQRLCDAIKTQIEQGVYYGVNDRKLHSLIASSSGNIVMPNLTQTLNPSISAFISITQRAYKEETVKTHQHIVDAIRAGNTEGARQAMQDHLLLSKWNMDDAEKKRGEPVRLSDEG